jgi:putative copper export protein
MKFTTLLFVLMIAIALSSIFLLTPEQRQASRERVDEQMEERQRTIDTLTRIIEPKPYKP